MSQSSADFSLSMEGNPVFKAWVLYLGFVLLGALPSRIRRTLQKFHSGLVGVL